MCLLQWLCLLCLLAWLSLLLPPKVGPHARVGAGGGRRRQLAGCLRPRAGRAGGRVVVQQLHLRTHGGEQGAGCACPRPMPYLLLASGLHLISCTGCLRLLRLQPCSCLTVMPMPRMSAKGTRDARSSSQHSRPMSSALSVKRASVTGAWGDVDRWGGGRQEDRVLVQGRCRAASQPASCAVQRRSALHSVQQTTHCTARPPERDRLSQSPCPMNFKGSAAPCQEQMDSEEG